MTYDSLRKFKHLAISLAFNAVSDVCQQAFDKTDFDPFPEVQTRLYGCALGCVHRRPPPSPPPLQVAPDERPGCVCPLDVKAFTQQTAAAVALVKMMVDAEGELPPAAEPRIVRVEKKFYYDDI